MSDLISRADAIEAVRVCDVFLAYQGDKIENNIDGFVDSLVEQMRDNISRAVSALPSADAVKYESTVTLNSPISISAESVNESCDTCKYYETSHEEYPCSDCTFGNSRYVSAEATIGDYPNDLISRSALMEYCSNQKSKSIDNNDIARFPSAEAVQGEWTYLSGSKGSYMTISCPICGSTFDGVAEWKYHFCPNCGARMKGGEDECV